MKDIEKILGKLTEEEKKIVLKLLGEEPVPKKDKPKKPKAKKARKKKRKRLDKGKNPPIIEQGRKSRRKRILLHENDEVEPPKMSIQGRTQSRNAQSQRGGSQPQRGQGRQGGKGAQAMSERYDTSGGRENKFLNMPEYKRAKGDVKKDKLLSGGNALVDRREAFEPIEVQCNVCNLWYDVSPNLVYQDPDLGLVYKCNNCGGR